MDISILREFLNILIAGGASAVGAIMSFLVENWPWFGKLASHQKRWAFLGLSVLIPVLSWLLAVALGYYPLVLEGAVYAVVMGIVTFAGGTMAHIKSNRPNAQG